MDNAGDWRFSRVLFEAKSTAEAMSQPNEPWDWDLSPDEDWLASDTDFGVSRKMEGAGRKEW